MGESMMPHVRMWERLQSSHVHLLGWVRAKIIIPCAVKLHEGKKFLRFLPYSHFSSFTN